MQGKWRDKLLLEQNESTLKRIWRRARRKPYRRSAHALYASIVDQARSPGFYQGFEVADSVDGRFDMVSLHVFLVLRRLRNAGAEADAFAQTLFDAFFADMDRSLREMGVGDLGVGKKVREMSKAFMGRIDAYDRALDAGSRPDLSDALARNLYRGEPPDDATLAALMDYIEREVDAMTEQPVDQIMRGVISFGPAA